MRIIVIEFRICLMHGKRDFHGRMTLQYVLDAQLYAWPDQWNGPDGPKLEELSAQLAAMETTAPDSHIGLDSLKKKACDMAAALTARGLKGVWRDGEGAFANRKLMGTR